MTINPPSNEIARAFGAAGSVPQLVKGGQGVTFRLGNVAVKRVDDTAQAEWLSGVMETVEEQGFRIARPIRSVSGNFVVDGWCATRWLDGTTAIAGRWLEAIAVCQAFHRALQHVPWSAVLEQTDNPYGQANARNWTESAARGLDIGPTADRLCRLLAPVTLPSQLIHGDPSEGNMLFAPGQPPGIIDIAPYWHPADYAIAMLVADGIAWSNAPLNLLAHVASWPQMDQLLIRAVLFRLYVGFLFHGGESGAERRASPYWPVIQAVQRWAGLTSV